MRHMTTITLDDGVLAAAAEGHTEWRACIAGMGAGCPCSRHVAVRNARLRLVHEVVHFICSRAQQALISIALRWCLISVAAGARSVRMPNTAHTVFQCAAACTAFELRKLCKDSRLFCRVSTSFVGNLAAQHVYVGAERQMHATRFTCRSVPASRHFDPLGVQVSDQDRLTGRQHVLGVEDARSPRQRLYRRVMRRDVPRRACRDSCLSCSQSS